MGKKNNKQVGKTVLSRAKRKSITKASQAKSTATKAAPKECRDAAASEDLDGLLGGFSFGSGGAKAKRLASKMRRKIKKRATPKKVKKKVKRGVEHASTRRGAL